jgi:anti-anti-sigma factor
MNGDLLTVTVERDGDVLVIRPSGELDLSTTQTLDAELRKGLAGDASQVILDLGGLSFIDSSGLRLLVFASARGRDSGDRLRMLRATEPVQRMLALTGLDHSLPLVD